MEGNKIGQKKGVSMLALNGYEDEDMSEYREHLNFKAKGGALL